jgi:hypothetical protein
MKKSIILVIIAFLMMLSYLSIEPLIANAGENNCILEASADVIVEVWNVDDKGNKGYRLWMGLIKQGQQKRIASQHGQIRYAYTTEIDENEPLSGDIDRSCENGNIIGVP